MIPNKNPGLYDAPPKSNNKMRTYLSPSAIVIVALAGVLSLASPVNAAKDTRTPGDNGGKNVTKDQATIDLSGSWDLYLGKYASNLPYDKKVIFPGTLEQNGIGTPSDGGLKRLSHDHAYKGAFTAKRIIAIPGEDKGKRLSLFIERTRMTKVFVNGKEVAESSGFPKAITTPQRYDITDAVNFGADNTIVIESNNNFEGEKLFGVTISHMATDETQTNWDGVLGRFAIDVLPPVSIDAFRVYPNNDLKSARVEVDVTNKNPQKFTGALSLRAEGDGVETVDGTQQITVNPGESTTFTIPDFHLGDHPKLWDEFHQHLYRMTIKLLSGSQVVDEKTDKFGMRRFYNDPQTMQLSINGKKVFFRGETACAVFPLTGSAPMDKASWLKLFRTYQSYGINAVRFHTNTPPEEAFDAADELGLYLLPELSNWNNNSCFATDEEKAFYEKEALQTLKTYANHPSFVAYSFGNELHYKSQADIDFAYALIEKLKSKDGTRLYASASNPDFGQHNFNGLTKNSDFYNAQQCDKNHLRGEFAGGAGFLNQEVPATTSNYSKAVSAAAARGHSAFGFEVGSDQVYPDVPAELKNTQES